MNIVAPVGQQEVVADRQTTESHQTPKHHQDSNDKDEDSNPQQPDSNATNESTPATIVSESRKDAQGL